MPSRNNSIMRRDINRLSDLVASRGAEVPALEAIADNVSAAAGKVNAAWQAFQAVSVQGDSERDERDSAIDELTGWIQLWRPVIMVKVPGAESNLRQLPSSGATPDDVIRVAEDMLAFMEKNSHSEIFREKAVGALGEKLESAKKETREATDILPRESVLSGNFTEACVSANPVLLRGLDIVRSAFGRTSPEYKQFIARGTSDEAEDEVPATGAAV